MEALMIFLLLYYKSFKFSRVFCFIVSHRLKILTIFIDIFPQLDQISILFSSATFSCLSHWQTRLTHWHANFHQQSLKQTTTMACVCETLKAICHIRISNQPTGNRLYFCRRSACYSRSIGVALLARLSYVWLSIGLSSWSWRKDR